MFPLVLIILHFTCFLFTDIALVISLWKNYKESSSVSLLLFYSTGSLYFSRSHSSSTPAHYTKHKHNNTESMGTSQENRKPTYLAKQRATMSHTDLRLSGFSNSQLGRYLKFTRSTFWLQVPQEINRRDQIPLCCFLHTSMKRKCCSQVVKSTQAFFQLHWQIKQ